MTLNSFRFKIALLSGLLTGVLLAGFGVVLWRASWQFNLDRLDREIRNIGQANLDRVLGGDHWVRLEEALKFVSGNRQSPDFILWVKNYDQEVYKSPEWPAGLDPESLPISNRYDTPGNVAPDKPPLPPRRGEEISPRNPALPRRVAQFHTWGSKDNTWRIGVMGNPYVTFVLGASTRELDSRMAELRKLYLTMIPIVFLLAVGGAWLVARGAIRPVLTLTQAAERVTARGLDQRIPPMTGDREFNRLIMVFNEMLNRLEKSFQQANRFSADASHELKTPLARLQAELEQALENSNVDPGHQEVYGSLLDEVSRLKAIVQKLLVLSIADAGQLACKRQTINLTTMVENVVEDCRAQASGLAVESNLTPNIQVEADAELLEQALQNLSSNAIKYNRPGGKIRFELAQNNHEVHLNVSNTGPGIPQDHRERLFQRFYRGDVSRSGGKEGVGLGLSLAREIIRAHGGEIALEDSDENWTTFSLRLPTH